MKKLSALFIFFLFFGIGCKVHASEQEFSIDNFTVKQGEEALVNYLKKKNLDSTVGSRDFVDKVNTLAENKDEFEGYNYDLLNAYASIYSSELEKSTYNNQNNDNTTQFFLDASIEKKTIKEIREENIKKNQEIENQIDEEQTIDDSLPIMQSKVVIGGSGYDKTAAKNYMKAHWNSTSSDKFNYYSLRGNDCTNFASQVVNAGGMSMKGTFSSDGSNLRSTTTDWYSRLNKRHYVYNTTSWVSVNDFYRYWVGTKKHTSYKYSTPKAASKYADTGDVIQLYLKSTGVWHHTVIVYDRNGEGGTIRYAAHTDAHLHKSLYYAKASDYSYRVIFFN